MAARWITQEPAEQAGVFRVNSTDGGQIIDPNGAVDYAGQVIPNFVWAEWILEELYRFLVMQGKLEQVNW